MALLGLIMLGLLGLGAVIFIQLQNRQEQDVIVVQPPTLPPPTFTPTPTVTPTPTDTPEPTSTPTLVVQPGQEQPEEPRVPPPGEEPAGPEVTPTNTLVVPPPGTPVPEPPVTGPPTGPEAMPNGGGVPPLASSGYLMGAGIMLLVLLTLGAVNRLKRPQPPGRN